MATSTHYSTKSMKITTIYVCTYNVPAGVIKTKQAVLRKASTIAQCARIHYSLHSKWRRALVPMNYGNPLSN
jgi:ribosome-interacting GTPase 1